MVDADWYVDPLGRFDGRFFDGENWTERVSDNGVLTIDPDFVPAVDQPGSTIPEPAVSPVQPRRRLQASLIEESPVRTVAVLAPSDEDRRPASSRQRTPIVWALLALIAALVVAGLLLFDNPDSGSELVAEPVELDRQQAERVEDLEAGGLVAESEADTTEQLEVDAPVGAVEADATFASDEAIEVGGLRVLNGVSVLSELQDWHQMFAAERGVELGPTASCWFGQLGGAAVQVAQCGPVGATADSEFLFDSVPLLFEDMPGGQIAQPVVDAATIDTVLANAVTLIGRDEFPSPLSPPDE